MEIMKYSFIVPVYKSEGSIARCIESVLEQKEPRFELILVDDGAPDKSGQICEEYAQKDSRIHVLHQENRGVSAARNAGVRVAKGEYIVFLDSDDYIDGDYLYHLNIIGNDFDIVVGGYIIENETGKVMTKRIYMEQLIDTSEKTTVKDCFEDGGLNYVWGRIIRTDIIRKNRIRFDEKLQLAEDTVFMLEVLACAKQIYFMPYVEYHYVKYGHQTLTSQYQDKELVSKLENVQNAIYKRLSHIIGETNARESVAIRVGKLYKNILIEHLSIGINEREYFKFLFHQYWFRQSLNYVDKIFIDENIKFKWILKAKSWRLFLVYMMWRKVKSEY